MYNSEVEKYINLHAELDILYEAEIERLMMKTHGQYLPQSVRDQFNDEFSFLCQRVNLGLRDPEKQTEFLLVDQNLDSLRSDFEKECPLLWDVIRTLFPVDAGGHTRRKELSFTHTISILMSLKDKDLRNDCKMCFSVLLLSYRVGC